MKCNHPWSTPAGTNAESESAAAWGQDEWTASVRSVTVQSAEAGVAGRCYTEIYRAKWQANMDHNVDVKYHCY